MAEAPTGKSETSPNVVLAMLLLVYTFNFLDRQILAIVAQPVKAELGISDTAMGLLGGLAFALLYATMAIPIGLIADRKGRAKVITISLAAWSFFTALCGLASGFWQLALCRLGVGIGEAGGVAPSYAIVAERFPPEQRARALSVYSLGAPLGVGAGALFGAMIASAVNWRAAFIVLGLAGLLAAYPFARLVRDRPIPQLTEHPPVGAVFKRLAGQPAFWFLSFGASMGSLCAYGLAFWVPTLLQRSYGLSLIGAGQFVGALQVLAGVAGMLAGGVLADRIGKGDRAGYARVPAIAYLLCFPSLLLAFMMRDATMLFVLLLLPSGLIYVWLGPVTTAIQHLVPAQERATASACFLLVNNGLGLGLGSLVIGKASDLLAPTYGADSLRYGCMIATGTYLLAGASMLLAAPRLRKAWIA